MMKLIQTLFGLKWSGQKKVTLKDLEKIGTKIIVVSDNDMFQLKTDGRMVVNKGGRLVGSRGYKRNDRVKCSVGL